MIVLILESEVINLINLDLVRKHRIFLGLTQDKMAEKLDLCNTTYKRSELGERVFKVDELLLFCKVCNLNNEQILELLGV